MLEALWTALVALLVTVDPLGLVPIFVALTAGLDDAERAAIVRRAVLVAGGVLLLFAVAGEAVLAWLGIGMPAFRVAGGLFLFLLALEMVFERRGPRRSGSAEELADDRPGGDLAVFPLAIPLIAGPAAITTTILAADRLKSQLGGRLAICAAVLIALAVTWAALLLAGRLARVVGATLIGVASRLLGLLLGALAAQYVLDGLSAVIRP